MKSPEAEFWSMILGRNVVAVYNMIPIIEEDCSMGARELRAAFNEVAQPAAVCIAALLEYESHNDTQWQILYFSGNYADGAGFTIKSDRIRPGVDVNQVARETADRLLQQKRGT